MALALRCSIAPFNPQCPPQLGASPRTSSILTRAVLARPLCAFAASTCSRPTNRVAAQPPIQPTNPPSESPIGLQRSLNSKLYQTMSVVPRRVGLAWPGLALTTLALPLAIFLISPFVGVIGVPPPISYNNPSRDRFGTPACLASRPANGLAVRRRPLPVARRAPAGGPLPLAVVYKKGGEPRIAP